MEAKIKEILVLKVGYVIAERDGRYHGAFKTPSRYSRVGKTSLFVRGRCPAKWALYDGISSMPMEQPGNVKRDRQPELFKHVSVCGFPANWKRFFCLGNQQQRFVYRSPATEYVVGGGLSTLA